MNTRAAQSQEAAEEATNALAKAYYEGMSKGYRKECQFTISELLRKLLTPTSDTQKAHICGIISAVMYKTDNEA